MIDDKTIKEVFISCFRKETHFIEDYDKRWESTLIKGEYIPVEYLPSSLKYQRAYVNCFYQKVIDLSVLVCERNMPICVWPITLVFDKDECWFSTNEKEVLPPFFVKGISHKEKNHIMSDCMKAINCVIDFVCNDYDVHNWKTRYSLLGEMKGNGSENWYRKCMENGGETDVITELYVNLELGLDSIHSSIRKHYKALINKGEKIWRTEIISSVSDEEIEYFMNRHIEVAGRETRSRETWLLQQEAVNCGNAFIVKLIDLNGEFVGESLFEHSRDEGLYSVGVYNRNLFDEPVSHIVQWKAIEHMISLGLRRYKIGQRFYSGRTLNLNQPTEKEISISYFKEGFATDYEFTFIVTNKLGSLM